MVDPIEPSSPSSRTKSAAAASSKAGARDIAVIGAGPAGLMAAEQLGRAGYGVDIFDQMPSPARKFLMAGRGGLNLTHSEPLEDFIARYGPASRWLRPLLEAFPPSALSTWAAGLGEETFVGTSGRVFPKSFKASPLLRAWLRRLGTLGVRLHLRHRWVGWTKDGGLCFTVDGAQSKVVFPSATLLALGGATWPRLGSDGAGLGLLSKAGVDVEPFTPFNAGINLTWSDVLLAKFEGAPLKRVSVSCGSGTAKGDVVITRRGLEGGAIYALNREIKAALGHSRRVCLEIDLRPELGIQDLAARLSRPRRNQSWSTFLRKSAGLSAASIAIAREPNSGDLPTDPLVLANHLKSVPLIVNGLANFDKAISSSGGVMKASIDDNFMLKTIPGTFIAGEMLDWDAPTGGYLLQATFATAIYTSKGVQRYLNQTTANRSSTM